jgi:hypothetical protein
MFFFYLSGSSSSLLHSQYPWFSSTLFEPSIVLPFFFWSPPLLQHLVVVSSSQAKSPGLFVFASSEFRVSKNSPLFVSSQQHHGLHSQEPLDAFFTALLQRSSPQFRALRLLLEHSG